jgi:hypothetical protein
MGKGTNDWQTVASNASHTNKMIMLYKAAGIAF